MQVKEKILRSVDSLETIYAVVVAFAVTKAIEGVLLSGESSNINLSLLLKHLPELVAFVVTIVPFYHGMHRHLNRVYVEREIRKTHQGYLF
jgi:fumarate reductase subunit D